ncbi:uncharacterized protein IL334_007783 [Kwoniella shivajii]|uniref:Uncharacterized protein n=1 Tax=Kwoniella shivajii TaxID=564305 RepID=A0ABZ1DBG0_9TREE|nr:hypothetical protein IL334_007783 [Kwoniella shivajii]
MAEDPSTLAQIEQHEVEDPAISRPTSNRSFADLMQECASTLLKSNCITTMKQRDLLSSLANDTVTTGCRGSILAVVTLCTEQRIGKRVENMSWPCEHLSRLYPDPDKSVSYEISSALENKNVSALHKVLREISLGGTYVDSLDTSEIRNLAKSLEELADKVDTAQQLARSENFVISEAEN